MKIIRGLINLPVLPRGCVLTMGNFDSVHRGHQTILQQLVKEAAHRALPSVVMVFEPQPAEFFLKEKAPVRLSCLRTKLELFQQYQVDFVWVVPFTATLAALTSNQFIQQYVVNSLKTRYLIVGDDFHFGKNRTGNFHYLQAVSEQYDFNVEETKTLYLADWTQAHHHRRRISSTWVREAIAAHDFKTVEQLLGHPYTICGHVAHGDNRGHQLGFPTANIYLKHDLSPVQGVYAVQIHGLSDQPLQGVASVGIRPTFGCTRPLLEIYILDFDEDIYGKRICIAFLHRMRDELKFNHVESLIATMHEDVRQTREFFRS